MMMRHLIKKIVKENKADFTCICKCAIELDALPNIIVRIKATRYYVVFFFFVIVYKF